MKHYIATFYSYFGALSLCKELQSADIKAELSPVPRKLSVSCGICVEFWHENWDCAKNACELEAIYQVVDGGHQEVFHV